MYTKLEILLGNLSFITLFCAMSFYWVQIAFSNHTTKKAESPGSKPTTLTSTERKQITPYSSQSDEMGTTTFNSMELAVVPNGKDYSTNNPRPLQKVGDSIFKSDLINGVMWNNKGVMNPDSGFYTKDEATPYGDGKSSPLRGQNQAPPVRGAGMDLNFGTISMLVANLCLFLLLVLRWIESGHFPLSNLYESLMFLSWCCTFMHFALTNLTLNSNDNLSSLSTETASHRSALKSFKKNLVGSITAPCGLFINAFATFSLPQEMQEAAPLVPALQSNWLMMHVTVMILSYAALILGSLFSITFLILTGGQDFYASQLPERNRDEWVVASSHAERENQIPYSAERSSSPGYGYKKNNQIFLKLAFSLDNLSYRILGIGFSFLTIGILSGAVWANEAWGSYWSWDPKETWAFLTWLVFAIYLHTRLTKGWEGKKPALIASVGFIVVWICFLGVNLIGEGLHSYGWIKS